MENRVPEVGDAVEVDGEKGVIDSRMIYVCYGIMYDGHSWAPAQTEAIKFTDAPNDEPIPYERKLKESLTCLADALESMEELGEAKRKVWAKQLRVVVSEIEAPVQRKNSD